MIAKAVPRNLSLDLAMKTQLDEIPDAEKEAFREAAKPMAPIVIGAVRAVITLAVKLVTFSHKLTEVICEAEGYLKILEGFSRASNDMESLQEAIATICGDLLRFCWKAHRIFEDDSRRKRKWMVALCMWQG